VLLRLLTLPVSVPIKGSLWVIDQILKAAEAELGQGAVQEDIAAARAAYDRGEIDDDELARRIDPLLDELLVRRAFDTGED